MRVLVVEPDLHLRSDMFTALNDAGFWSLGLSVDRPAVKLPAMRRPPRVLVTDLDGGAFGNGVRIAAALRKRWDKLGVVYTATSGSPVPPLGPRDRVLRKPFAPADLVAQVQQLA